MTTGLAVVITIVSLAALAIGIDRLALVGGVVPGRLSGLVEIAPAMPVWLTPLSATLLHGGLMHLIINMVMLLWIGRQVEVVYGGGGTLAAWIVGAYGSAVAQWLAGPGDPSPMIGASGAISAWFGIYALSFSRPKWLTRFPALNRIIHAGWLLTAWVLVQLASAYLAAQGQGMMLATAAHVGGFVVGMAIQRPLLMWRYRSA